MGSLQEFYEGRNRLALFILLAIIVHIVLITTLKFQQNTPIKLPIIFDVRLRPIHAPEKQIEVEPSNTKSGESLTSIPVKKSQILQAPITNKVGSINSVDPMLDNVPNKIDVQPNTEPPVATINITPNTKASKPKIFTETLLESAHRIAIEDAKTMPKEKGDGILLADRPVLPKLALMLAKKKGPAGVTNFPDGSVKIVNPDGSSYCLQLPSFTSGPSGSFESISIPMSCPKD